MMRERRHALATAATKTNPNKIECKDRGRCCLLKLELSQIEWWILCAFYVHCEYYDDAFENELKVFEVHAADIEYTIRCEAHTMTTKRLINANLRRILNLKNVNQSEEYKLNLLLCRCLYILI